MSRFSVLSGEKRLFSEAILCLMCLCTNPLSKRPRMEENILEAKAEFNKVIDFVTGKALGR